MINEKEREILWVALNNLQNAGMNKMPMYRAILEPVSKNGTDRLTQLGIKDIVEDWIKQTVEEYELCESLKVKLCSEKQTKAIVERDYVSKEKLMTAIRFCHKNNLGMIRLVKELGLEGEKYERN